MRHLSSRPKRKQNIMGQKIYLCQKDEWLGPDSGLRFGVFLKIYNNTIKIIELVIISKFIKMF